MPITPLDDYLVHQTPETVDRVYTSDRNFYDRYFYGMFSRDGRVYLMVAFGCYPNVGVMDAFATAVIDGKTQHIVRASKALAYDRMDTKVGPIGIEIVEPLRKSRVHCEANDGDLQFDLTFEGVAAPYEEPHFLRMAGSRRVMDYTRMTQHGRWSGAFTASGQTYNVDQTSWWGARDHSWGIRPLGGEPQGAPAPDAGAPGFFWQWSPVQFDDRCLMYTVSEEGDGRRWHAAAEFLYPYAANTEPEPLTIVSHDIELKSGTRLFNRGALQLRTAEGKDFRVTMEPLTTLYMAGGGYSYLGGWRHGQYRGPLVVEHETWDLTDAETVRKAGVHTQTVCNYTVEGLDGVGEGQGVFELLILGLYQPYGFNSFADVAP